MPDYARLTMAETADRLPKKGNVLILLHMHPDGDAIGSGFALRRILEVRGCRAFCVCADEIPERLHFLVGDEQKSILKENLPADFRPDFIAAVDTASPSQFGTLFPFFEGKIDLMIDHHGKGTMYADGWIIPGCSSAGEMIFNLSRLLVERGELPAVPPEADRFMYAAVSSDTGCFRYSNATPSAHSCAAELLKAGFDASEINHYLFEVKSHRLLVAEQLGMDRVHMFAGGRIGVVDFPIELKRSHHLNDEHLETLVDIPRGMEGVLLSAAVRQPTEEKAFRVSVRSSCSVDVSRVCASFGGGGHVRAAGCTLFAPTIERAVDLIAQALTKALLEAHI